MHDGKSLCSLRPNHRVCADGDSDGVHHLCVFQLGGNFFRTGFKGPHTIKHPIMTCRCNRKCSAVGAVVMLHEVHKKLHP